ncbi:MAG TPA: sulfotransferase [Solirubrobacteraceae bacterium]|nr:sulfotransferase [Solirubrobacteraceae bacterium]
MRMSGEPVRVPDFFLVGHPKCGTTALYEMLRRHPRIFMPALKEPRFFASDMRQRFQPSRSGALPSTLESYLALFADAPPEQRAGEASPSYLASHTAAGLIAQVQPNARIVAILREPASFLRSLHLQLLRSHVETKKDLRRAISLEDARREGRGIPRRSHRPAALQYSDHVRYVEQLRRYHAVFPRERVLVLIYDDFRADNDATVRRVLRFLDVDDSLPVETLEANPRVRVRSQQLDELVHRVSVGKGSSARAANVAVKALLPRPVRRRALEATRRRVVYAQPSAPDEALMCELRRRYLPEVWALSEYLDRDLVELWGYDRLD